MADAHERLLDAVSNTRVILLYPFDLKNGDPVCHLDIPKINAWHILCFMSFAARTDGETEKCILWLLRLDPKFKAHEKEYLEKMDPEDMVRIINKLTRLIERIFNYDAR